MNTEKIKIINLTPHELKIKLENGEMLTIPASGSVARVAETREDLGVLAGTGVKVTRAKYGQVENLPLPKKGTVFIVSALVLQAVPGRLDVFAPGPALRDETGKIVGADGLSANISTMDREKVSPELSAVIAAEKDNLVKAEEAAAKDAASIKEEMKALADEFKTIPPPVPGKPTSPRRGEISKLLDELGKKKVDCFNAAQNVSRTLDRLRNDLGWARGGPPLEKSSNKFNAVDATLDAYSIHQTKGD